MVGRGGQALYVDKRESVLWRVSDACAGRGEMGEGRGGG